jgi:hypothetical protein
MKSLRNSPRPRRNVRDVCHPQSIGAVGKELPVDEIDRALPPGIGLRRDHVPPQRRAAQARRSPSIPDLPVLARSSVAPATHKIHFSKYAAIGT